MKFPTSVEWKFKGVGGESKDKKIDFINSIKEGYLITGGATLPWYSGIDLILSLSRLGYEPKKNWELVYEEPGEITRWRVEPLRIWRITPSK